MAFSVTHITPIDDEREHDEAPDCWCGPTLDDHEGSLIYVHNAADMREEYERITDSALPGKPWLRSTCTFNPTDEGD